MNELQRFMYRYVCQLISCKYFPYYWISPVLASGVKDPLSQLLLKPNTPGPWLLRISKVQFSLVNIFKKVAQISSLCDFHYINEGTPSLMHFWFVMTKGLHVWLMLIFARPEKCMSQGPGIFGYTYLGQSIAGGIGREYYDLIWLPKVYCFFVWTCYHYSKIVNMIWLQYSYLQPILLRDSDIFCVLFTFLTVSRLEMRLFWELHALHRRKAQA